MNPKFKFCYIAWALTFNSWIHNDVLLAFVFNSLIEPFEVLQLFGPCSSNFCFLCNYSNLCFWNWSSRTWNLQWAQSWLPPSKSFHALLMIRNIKISSIQFGHEGITHTFAQMWCKIILISRFGEDFAHYKLMAFHYWCKALKKRCTLNVSNPNLKTPLKQLIWINIITIQSS
jgi:hypothetical protein